MTVETETYLTLKEYMIVTFRLFYKKVIPLLLSLYGGFCLFFILLWVVNIVAIESNATFYSSLYFAVLAVAMPLFIFLNARKQYKSNKLLVSPRRYRFNDEKISYSAEGMEGNFEWRYILKYRVVGNFLVLFLTNRGAIFIKINKLTAVEVNFILSKIKRAKTN